MHSQFQSHRSTAFWCIPWVLFQSARAQCITDLFSRVSAIGTAQQLSSKWQNPNESAQCQRANPVALPEACLCRHYTSTTTNPPFSTRLHPM